MPNTIVIMVGVCLMTFLQMLFFFSRYKKCPPDKLLVIFGKVSEDPNEKYRVITSGAIFVWPILQDYFLLDANPIEIIIEENYKLQNGQQKALKINFLCKISKDENLIYKAAESFYKKEESEIVELIKLTLNDRIRKEINSSSNIIDNAIENLLPSTLNELGIEMIALKEYEVK